MFLILFPLVLKKIQDIGLEYRLFFQMIKIEWKIVGETDTAPEEKNKTK